MVQLHEKMNFLREKVLKRAFAKMPELTEHERRIIDIMTQRLEHKFLREPMTAMNAAAGTPDEERLRKVICELFLMKTNLIIGTRQSLLAMWQSNYIAGRLREEYPGCEVTLKKIVTKGDRILDVPLAKIGGKSLFTKEIEQELLDGTIDLAVHSLKDMPTVLPEGLCLRQRTWHKQPAPPRAASGQTPGLKNC